MSRARGAALAALAVAALAGCGGGSSVTSQSPARVLRDSIQALTRVHSYHLQLEQTDRGTHVSLSAEIEYPGRVQLSFVQDGAPVEMISVGTNTYLRASAAFWRRLPAGGDRAAVLFGNRWVIAPNVAIPGIEELRRLADPAFVARCGLGPTGRLTRAGRTSVGGVPAIVIRDDGNAPGDTPGAVDVATKGPPLPLRVLEIGASRPGPNTACDPTASQPSDASSRIDFQFDQFNRAFGIAAPRDAVNPRAPARRPAPLTIS